jgi:mRNA-degrading endonuclease RelE of RelBE toxin-antitoxin system
VLGKQRFDVVVSAVAQADISALKAFEQRKVTESIQTNLIYEPFRETRNRKPLPGLVPGFEHVPPVWELRVGGIRVFYDGNADTLTVNIRAVRLKPSGKTTEEITR